MGRRSTWMDAQRERQRLEERTMNPIWRGVGCMLVALMAVFGWLFADWFLTANAVNRWIVIPRQLFYPTRLTFLHGGVLIKIAVAFLSLLMAWGIINFIYAIFFPVRPGEHDVETPRRRRRKKP